MTPVPGPVERHVPIRVLVALGVASVAALPLLVAALLTVLLPDIGRLRTDGGGRRGLHLLWVYPVFAIATWLFIAPVARRTGRATTRVGEIATATALAWTLLTALFQVFLEDAAGAAVAGVVALAALTPFALLLRRAAPDDDATDDSLPT